MEQNEEYVITFSKKEMGYVNEKFYPDNDLKVITKWGHKVESIVKFIKDNNSMEYKKFGYNIEKRVKL